VTIGMNLRRTLSSTMLAFAMAAAIILAPMGAQADTNVSVCNTASANGQGGNMIVDGDLDPQAPVHNSSNLSAKKGGNVNAAMHSRALSMCNVPATPPVDPPPVGGYAT
jgi:hypothetical protein